MHSTPESKLMRLITAPLRYRSAKGFGVHSPFAFRFINDVLCEQLPYYAYEHIIGKYNRLLFRVVNHFAPNQIVLNSDHSQSIDLVISLSAPEASVISPKSCGKNPLQMLILDNIPNADALLEMETIITERLQHDENFAIVVMNINNNRNCKEFCNRLKSIAPYGMNFGNGEIEVFTMLRKLPRQSFSVWL